MEQVLFFVLAGGKGERLAPLTAKCPKPLVRFGHSDRIIDYVLYNCLTSAGEEIILLTQHLSEMVETYVGETWQPIFKKHGKTLRVAAGKALQKGHYFGTADAVYQNLSTRDRLPKEVVVLAADHIYRMDYRSLIRFHRSHNKTATIGAVPCDRGQASRFGIIEAKSDGTISGFHEKPNELDGIVASDADPLASMGIYAFSTRPLIAYLKRNQCCTSNDFGKDVLPEMVQSRDAKVFPFLDSCGQRAYWRDVGDLPAYHSATNEFYRGQQELLRFHRLPNGWRLPTPNFLKTTVPADTYAMNDSEQREPGRYGGK